MHPVTRRTSLAQAPINPMRARHRQTAGHDQAGFRKLMRIADEPASGEQQNNAAHQQSHDAKSPVVQIAVNHRDDTQRNRADDGGIFKPIRCQKADSQHRHHTKNERRQQTMHGAGR